MMKKTLFLSLFFFGLSIAVAQPYFFSQNKQAYTDLSTSTSLNNGDVWGGFQSFLIPIGFTFNYMGSDFTSVYLEATGRLIFDENHYYYADMFVVSGMTDKGTSSSLSPLSYQLTGANGNQILKIEINNASYQNDLSSSINYQIWLYENGGVIELHMGPSNINNPADAFSLGPFSGVFQVSSFTPINYIYGFALYDAPAMPSDSTFTGTGINTSPLTLENIPSDSTVYRFSKDAQDIGVNDIDNSTQFSVFPNPATGQFTFLKSVDVQKEVQLKLLDLNSKVILEKTIPIDQQQTQLDISTYSKGVYYLNLIVDDKQYVKQLLKN